MAKQIIGVGAQPDDGTGDTLRAAFIKVNDNFTELYDDDAADNLDAVTTLGNTTTNSITVGGLVVDTDTLVVDSANNRVGIGTDSPDTALNVRGDLLIEDSAGTRYVRIDAPDAANGYVGKIGTTSSHDLALLSANTERMRIDSSGNVGIGATSPSEKLSIQSGNVDINGVSSYPLLKIRASGLTSSVFTITQDTANPKFSVSDARDFIFESNSQERMRIDSIGNVGMNAITNPTDYDFNGAATVVGNPSGFGTLSIVSSATGVGYLSFADGSSGIERYRGRVDYDHSTDSMQFRTSGTERLRIDSSGRVGIGTTSPSAKLEVKAAQSTSPFPSPALKLSNSTLTNNTGLTSITLATSSVDDYGVSLNSWRYGTTGDPKFVVKMHSGTSSGIDALTINSSGNVGIGETSIDAKLHITTPTAGLVNQKFESAGSAAWRLGIPASQTYFAFDNSNDSLGSPKLVIDSSGNVGIGTTSPSGKLSLQSTININDSTNFQNKIAPLVIGDVDGVDNSRVLLLDSNQIESNGDGLYLNFNSTQNVNLVLGGGNVGIGTSSPAVPLNIQATNAAMASNGIMLLQTNSAAINNGGQITFGTTSSRHAAVAGRQESTGGTAGYLQFGTRASTGDITERMRIDSSGNVGIGTTSPETKLHTIQSGAGEQIISIFQNNENADETKASIQLRNANNDFCSTKIISHRTGANFGADLTFELSDNVDGSFQERMRITEAGNVGIGTTSPDSPLTIMAEVQASVPSAGESSSHIAIGKNNQYGTMIGTLGSGLGYIQQQRFDGAATTYDLLIQPNGGNVGIGTTSPAALLDISSTTDGVLLPRMTTTQVNAISSPENGLTVYNTTLNTLCFYNGTSWQKVTSSNM